MKTNSGLSEEAARADYQFLNYGKDGRIDAEAENIRNFFIEYGIIEKEKAPAVRDLYSPDFLR